MIITFNRAVEGQEPNAGWEAKLATVSDKFRDLAARARAAVAPQAASSAPPGVPSVPAGNP
jgi:hypothetical protein